MNLNLLSNVTSIMKSSIRARPSPRHTRGPKTQNKNLPSFTPGLKVGAFSARYPRWPTDGAAAARPRTCRKGHEGLWFNKLSLVVEEVLRVEVVWKFPLSLFLQNRSQMWDDERSLGKRTHVQPVSLPASPISALSQHAHQGQAVLTLGIECPMTSVSLVQQWKTLRGTVLATLCTSWITAWGGGGGEGA